MLPLSPGSVLYTLTAVLAVTTMYSIGSLCRVYYVVEKLECSSIIIITNIISRRFVAVCVRDQEAPATRNLSALTRVLHNSH